MAIPDDIGASFFRYLPYNQEDEDFGIVCIDAGYCKLPPRSEYPSCRCVSTERTSAEFQIIYIIEGEGAFETENAVYPITPGSVILGLPGVKRFYKPQFDSGWNEYWVGFRGCFFDNMLKNNLLNREKVFFTLGDNSIFVASFQSLFRELSAQEPLYQLKAGATIISLISELLVHDRRRKQPDYSQKIIEKAKCFMEQHLYSDISIPQIAQKIGISASKLNEIFKQYNSMPPYQYFLSMKIQEAKNILSEKDISIKALASSLGFQDEYYFSRLFRKKAGLPTRKWKAELLRQNEK
jgi:AraC-like DNA-binding protein